ncbi:Transmembrane protease serine 11C [Gracilariopsis chorda]|uniref:Transmembrane protease serine 11C n=1 Tax=Gracilariopsis chorda TaxID=448386 RepID=A0A2V3IGI4_9FLOR|nr:Transmembrane protease serine 11C [Gracilariopsis chorda]|eukprot:PXF40260.1 Transmembrane protease serine 11C [Gracilariopsis chorda]
MLWLTFLLALSSARVVSSRAVVPWPQPVVSDEPVLSEDPECPVVLPISSNLSQLVLGGQLVQHDDLLFHAWLSFTDVFGGSNLCSATRLSKNWVLTAAHCDVTTAWRVSLSSPSVGVENGIRASIQSVHIHPNFTYGTADPSDYALLRIVPPPSEQGNVHVVRLNEAPSLPVENAFVRVSGYGIYENYGALEPTAGELHFADIPIHPFSTCSSAYASLISSGLSPLKADNHLCMGYELNRCNACRGDSGGPVLQYDKNGRAVQVGIITASYECARTGFPGIGLRVSAALAWMREVGAVFESAEPEQVFRDPVTTQDAMASHTPSQQPGLDGADDSEVMEAQDAMASHTPSQQPGLDGVDDSEVMGSSKRTSESSEGRWIISMFMVVLIVGLFVGVWASIYSCSSS